MSLPLFVTFTGADHARLASHMKKLQTSFPGRVEWGILVSEEQVGQSRFATRNAVSKFVDAKLNLSAHICGTLAERILNGDSHSIDLFGFQRVQLNLLHRHAEPHEVENAISFGRANGIKTILQCGDAFPDVPQLDWLLDNSFGEGVPLTKIPTMLAANSFCGVSGGLSGQNIVDVNASLQNESENNDYWFDMESSVRKEGEFSVPLCRDVCAALFSSNTSITTSEV